MHRNFNSLNNMLAAMKDKDCTQIRGHKGNKAVICLSYYFEIDISVSHGRLHFQTELQDDDCAVTPCTSRMGFYNWGEPERAPHRRVKRLQYTVLQTKTLDYFIKLHADLFTYTKNGRYSRASDNGPSEKRTASLQRTTVVLRIVSSITLMLT